MELKPGRFYQIGGDIGRVYRPHFEEKAGWWELEQIDGYDAYIVAPSGHLYAGWSPSGYTLDDVKELPLFTPGPNDDPPGGLSPIGTLGWKN